MLYRSLSPDSQRRGIVLLVVLAMLTLFASVAVAFVYFSESTTVEMTLRKEAEQVNRPDPDLLIGFALNQLVHDGGSFNSALRTHSLLTNLYGSMGNSPYSGLGRRRDREISNIPPLDDGVGPPTVLWTSPGPPLVTIRANPFYLINYAGRPYNPVAHGEFNPDYTYPDHNSAFLGAFTADGIVTARSFVRVCTPPLPLGSLGSSYSYGFNPYDPYCLDGSLPSGAGSENGWYRAFWTSAVSMPPGFLSLPPAVRKAMVMRPGPWDAALGPVFDSSGTQIGFTSLFPVPEDVGGDVKNLPPHFRTLVGWWTPPGSPPGTPMQPIFANNDSIWIDLDFPIQTDSATGRKYKPLFAFFIASLDHLINLNVAGNVRGSALVQPAGAVNLQHASAHGLGPWEINPTYLSTVQSSTPLREWLNLFGGTVPGIAPYPSSLVERGRYGWDLTLPVTDPAIPPGVPVQVLPQDRASSVYSQFCFDGTQQQAGNYNPALPYLPPTADPNDPRVPGPHALSYDRHPRFASRSGAYWGWNSTTALASMFIRPGRPTNSPSFFNPFWGPFGNNRLFGPWDMEALLRHGDTGTDALNSDLRRLMPNVFSDPQARLRVTTISNDPNRIGAAPWYRPIKVGETLPPGPPLASPDYDLQMGSAVGPLPPAVPFPYGSAIPMPPDGVPPPIGTMPAGNGDYVANSWKSQLSDMLKLDLNRPLPPYPVPRQDPSNPARLVIDVDNAGVLLAFEQARLARQEFALAIWMRLIMATGALNPTGTLAGATPEKINALRYLAQLAVNMVDYVDNSPHTYPTPFNWGSVGGLPGIGLGNEWVYGTKQPRVVLNEVYIESAGTGPNYRVFVELCNPMKDPGSREYLANPPGSLPTASPGIYGVYQIQVVKRQQNQHLRQPNNAAGDPAVDPTPDQPLPADFTDLPGTLGFNPGENQNFVIDPAGDRFRGPDASSDPNLGDPTAANKGFYLAGPTTPLAPPAGPGDPHVPVPSYQTNRLQCTRIGGGSLSAEPPTILLRRLLVPYLPPNPPLPGGPVNPALPYNPYITVDYVEEVPVSRDDQPMTARQSYGKSQPLASHIHTWRRQAPHGTPGPISPPVGSGAGFTPPYTDVALVSLNNQPQTTFFRHNSLEEVVVTTPLSGPGGGLPTGPTPLPETRFRNQTLDLPFTWLPQLERHLMNVSELLGVSGFKPHELMQQFLAPATYTPNPINAGTAVSVTVAGAITTPPPPPGVIVGITHGHAWSIQTGDVITVGHGATAERVVVTVTGPDTFTADFTQSHSPSPLGLPSGVSGVIIGTIKNGHTPPWFNTSARLHRFLELVETRHRMAGASAVTFAANLTPVPSGPILPAPPYPPFTLQTPVVVQVTPAAGSDPFGFTANGALYGIGAGSTVVLNPGDPNEEAVRVISVLPPSPVLPNGAFTCVVQRQHPGAVTVMATAQGGVHPGKVNINLVADVETFTALADPQVVNAFNPTLGLITSAPTPGGISLVSPTSLRWVNVWPPPPTVAGTPLGLQVGSTLVFSDPFHMRQRVTVQAIAQDNSTVPPSTLITFAPPLPGMVPPLGPAPGTPVAVDNIPALFTAVRNSRDPIMPTSVSPFIQVQDGRVGSNPVRSLTAGYSPVSNQHPIGQGLNNTVMRDRPGDPLQRSLLEIGRPGETIDFRRHELLMKLTNNLTTRSNVFAVWCTVGYFEVLPTDPVTQVVVSEGTPGAVYRLGAELGRLEGRHKRHRFFAIVDRSVIDAWVLKQGSAYSVSGGSLSPFGGASFPVVGNAAIDPRRPTDVVQRVLPAAAPAGSTVTIGTIASLSGLVPGAWLFVDDGANSEWVQATAVPPNYAVTFRKPHAAGTRLRSVLPPAVVYWNVIE